ncbi:hypothetical protein HBI18_154680 [Parastagonospora nodorum]|nr:hypothetical protein HBH77_096610 [Parastagonospora nodorum]KAH5720768.1 hypothetical protein HBI18_154680 [Parastagonospora nodorum]KAH6112805.1 hypothetical protein HBI64_212880 [Parastagonospora nodorum]
MYSAGTISWLPPKQKIPSEHLTTTNGIDEGYFGHPVLILAIDSAQKEAAVLIITSFGGKSLLAKFPRERGKKMREEHIPIYPSHVHPDNGSCLFLADGEHLSKRSYVKSTPVRIVKVALLQPWDQGKCRLKTKCLRKLLKKINFASPWPNNVHHHEPAITLQPEPRQPPVHYQMPPPYQLTVQPQRTEPRYKQTPRTITCASEYRVPGQWVHSTDRPARIHTSQRTPLLPRTHNTVRTPAHDDSGSSCIGFTTLAFIAIVLFAVYKWYN